LTLDSLFTRFQVHMAVNIRITIFRNLTPCYVNFSEEPAASLFRVEEYAQESKWCAHREGKTDNGALNEPVGTQWFERAVFRGCQDGRNMVLRG
jgi:hypothetical protein